MRGEGLDSSWGAKKLHLPWTTLVEIDRKMEKISDQLGRLKFEKNEKNIEENFCFFVIPS